MNPLRAARIACRMSVADVADTVGCSQSELRRYETGAIQVPDDMLIRLALVYGDKTLLEGHPVVVALESWKKAA